MLRGLINKVEWTTLKLGLSKDPLDPTHPPPLTKPDPPPTESIALAIGDGFCSPKIEIGESGIGSPPLKSEKPELIDPVVFSSEYWDFFGKI